MPLLQTRIQERQETSSSNVTSWVEQITTTAPVPVACFDTPEGFLETLPEGVFLFKKMSFF
jgi:hypothetical protein